MIDYTTFLMNKMPIGVSTGKEIPIESVNSILFPFQRVIVQWAVRKGRCAIFADTGLGKTFMQLEWARLVNQTTLIIAPLAVAQQTVTEAEKLGIDVQYIREQSQVSSKIVITNYEMVDKLDVTQFGAAVLDESSILKSYDGKTRTKLIQLFQNTQYRLCCTATPAPNDVSELANHAEFLGALTRQEMLASYFVHDDTGWRLKRHGVEVFWQWLASWAMVVKLPSDIGFEDDGYILPPLNTTPVWVAGNEAEIAQQQGTLFPMGLRGITGRASVRKATLQNRVSQTAAILNDSNEQWIVWCGMNEEGRQLAQQIPDAVLVEGKDSLDAKIQAAQNFTSGAARVLITKSSIMGFGLNFQHCHNVIFLGLNDSYEQYYQAIRRCWRFGQQHPVNCQIVLSTAEQPILENVWSKENMNKAMAQNLVNSVAEYEKQELGVVSTPNANSYHPTGISGKNYQMFLGDCVEWLPKLPEESIDFSVFSPPFAALFTYSASERDMGNCRSEDEFFTHFAYMIGELYRVAKPGRIVAIHVAQIAATLAHDGFIGIKDYRGRVIQAFIDQGFIFHGDITVDKNPQAQAIRTHSKALLFRQLNKDASWLRPGLADYILVFRKPGENTVPIHPDINNEDWIKWAHPVWYDIRESDTLNTVVAKSNADERHICPLQLGLIERCIRLWSNPGETVLSPFAGIGSEGYQALLFDRRFVGIELKEEYFNVAVRNLEEVLTRKQQGKLL